MVTYFSMFSLAVLISLLSTGRVMAWAMRKGWVDRPDSCRKLHSSPIPRIGGIAIYISILLTLGCVYCFPTTVAASFRSEVLDIAKLMAVSGMMVLVGLWDDLRSLKPWTKFTAQAVIAFGAWLMGFRILSSWSSEGTILSLGLLSLPLTILWIVGITNAFNLIDGVDGLAAGAALFATSAMLVPSFHQGQLLSPVMLLALAGSIIGFLRFNFSPASIFLGDSGSFLLGSMLSLMAVQYSYKSTTAFAIGVPIVALGLPVLDTGMVVFRRFLNGKPIFLGDRRHIHHILIERGLKPRNAVILLYGVCGLFGLFSLLFLNPSGRKVGIILVLLGIFICVGIQQLHCFEFKELIGYILRGIKYQRRYLIGNVMAGKMIDGFHSARNLPDVLISLSSFLDEMEFSRAEVRVPGLDENCLAMNLKNWTVREDGPDHFLCRWGNPRKGGFSSGAANVPAGDFPDVLSTHFRLEFVFRIRSLQSGLEDPFEARKGRDIGRLTFYHPTTARLPVSAVCLLSRQVWKEFDQAINRISATSSQELIAQSPDSHSSAGRLLQDVPAIARMALIWAAPIVSRFTGFNARR
jgi:UDP-GlcNAc:undecaprenyl-phosphate/decaprenyl-phosphate GlcNAc-1-phosphate transferase